jgi:serine/threonine-protein kinase
MSKLQMDPGTWAQLNRLLDAALDRPAAERDAWLETLPGDLDALKPRLRDLLANAAQVETRDFLGALPKVALLAEEPAGGALVGAGDVVGRYRLVRELGRGGMGTVWLAERIDGMLNRPVALKLPHGHWRPDLAERMAREREILAHLEHPNIARLYDAGLTDQGRPYLALEYVEGHPIDEYCIDRHLDLAARLRLFVQVANAVAYAHGKLVVHRDLKPANLFVTAAGDARLLDFGIAKLLSDDGTGDSSRASRLTEMSGRAMTPDYASPEQILGEPLAITADIYSLGVVLYELLTGKRPYRLERDSRGALEDAIIGAEPARPSAVADARRRKALRGDLDTIVQKALRKDPRERYATVNAFADDIERHLAGRPVLARPDGRWYRVSRFLGRNKLAVGAAAAVLLAIFAGVAVALWQANVALAEARRAAEVKDFVTSILSDANEFSGGKALSVIDLLKQARTRIDSTFESRPDLRVELLNVVATSLLGLEDTDAAEEIAAHSLRIADASLPDDHPAALRARVLAAEVDHMRGRTQSLRERLDRVIPVLRRNVGDSPAPLIDALRLSALGALEEGRHADSIVQAQEAADVSLRRLGDKEPRTANALLMLAYAYLYDPRQAHKALGPAEHARRLAHDIYGADSGNDFVTQADGTYGRALASAGELERGIGILEKAQRDVRRKYGPESLQAGILAQNLVMFQLKAGQLDAAIENSDVGVRLLAKHVNADSHSHARGLRGHAASLLAARRGAEALAKLDETLASYRAMPVAPAVDVNAVRLHRALALAYLDRLDEAEREAAPAIGFFRTHEDPAQLRALYVDAVLRRLRGDPAGAMKSSRELVGRLDEEPQWKLELGRALIEVGSNELELGSTAQATGTLQRALDLFRELQPKNVTPDRADALLALGRAHLAAGRASEARVLLAQADSFWRSYGAQSRWARDAAEWLGRAEAAARKAEIR